MDSEQGDKFDPYSNGVQPETRNNADRKLPPIANTSSSRPFQLVEGHDIFNDNESGGRITLTIERNAPSMMNDATGVHDSNAILTENEHYRNNSTHHFPQHHNDSAVSLFRDADHEHKLQNISLLNRQNLPVQQRMLDFNNIEGRNTKLVNQDMAKRLQTISMVSRKSGAGSDAQTGNKSYSGFDVGQTKACGSFFANLRQQQNEEDGVTNAQSFHQSEKMSGLEFIDRLIKQQEDRYHKRLPFERGHYHQCFPNPAKKNSLITVKLVNRVLDGLGNTSAETHDVFDEDQAQFKTNFSDSQKFQTYDICALQNKDEVVDAGEGEDQDSNESEVDSLNDDVEDGPSQNSNRSGISSIKKPAQQKEYKMGEALSGLPGINSLLVKTQKTLKTTIAMGEEQQQTLYKDLHENVDVITGISPKEWATIQKSARQRSNIRARMNSSEFAIVGFWDLDSERDQMVCLRFFIIPNPLKRMIKCQQGTVLQQFLYVSEHTQEVFFFFKGYEVAGGDDLQQRQNEFVTQIAFINFDLCNQSHKQDTRHNMVNFCHKFSVIDQNSVLQKFLQDLNDTPYEAQKQLPNPTCITTINALPGAASGKTIVFTAYLKEKYHSKSLQKDKYENDVQENWYPTIFFFDLDMKQVVWEIFGSELFIKITKQKKVYVLTNEFYGKVQKSQYDLMKESDEKGFSVHESYYPSCNQSVNDVVQVMIYNVSPSLEQVEDRAEIAPRTHSMIDYKLKYGLNKNLKITEVAKVVEAFMHNEDKKENRLTLLYHGLGSYTFKLKPSLRLDKPSDWFVVLRREHQFHISLEFKPGRLVATGSGWEENDKKIDVNLNLKVQDMTLWHLMLDMGDSINEVHIDALKLDKKKKSMTAQWRDNERNEFKLKGSFNIRNKRDSKIEAAVDPIKYGNQPSVSRQDTKLNSDRKAKKQNNVEFKIHERSADSEEGTKIFQGYIDNLYTRIKGLWFYEDQESDKKHFDMKLQEPADGTITFTRAGMPDESIDVKVDFNKKKIVSADGDKDKLKLEATEAVDTGQLVFFILQPDTSFVRTDKDCFVQAKLVAMAEQNDDSNGKGVVQASVVLYKVSETIKEKKQKDKQKKIVQEPISRNHIRFYLDQKFLRTQERKESQLWHVCPSRICDDGRVVGSVIYEEYGSDMIRLCFVTSNFSEDVISKNQEVFDHPQEPLMQGWICDYPLLAYKTSSPHNKEITIVHMALTMPQKIIHLGQWEFVCFVNHTQMVEQKLFKKAKETNCDIMFLVRREEQYRLMSFKSNPWLEFEEDATTDDSDVHKETLFLFSGKLKFMPTEDERGEEVKDTPENAQRYARQFSADKIQNVQLLTHTLGNYDQYMLIIQFNDCIVQASLNTRQFKIICKSEAMVRRHLIRGYNEKVYYAETVGNAVKIQELEFHKSHPNEITKKEIFQLAGSKMVAFEADGESTQNDLHNNAHQSLFIMNDMHRIFQIVNEDDVRFVIKNTLDFSRHKKNKEITALRENDWAHVHVTQRTLSFGDMTYNLHSDASLEITVPKYQFGEAKKVGPLGGEQSVFDDVDSSDDDQSSSGDEKKEDCKETDDDWDIQDVQAMSMTANMIILAQRNHKEFCFVVKPAPGSRRVNIVGYQQLHEIEQMLFVSNTHVLLRLRGGKTVTLMANGSIVPQQPRVQVLLEQNSRVVGESQIYKGRKTVLLEQRYGEGLRLLRYVTLQFAADGVAELVGIFDQPKAQLKKIVQQMAAMLVQSEIDQRINANNGENHEPNSSQHNLVSQKIQPENARKFFNVELKNEKSKDKIEALAKRMKTKHAKEFFVTENGEVVKMAGIITQDPHIIKELKEQRDKEHTDAYTPAEKKKYRARRRKLAGMQKTFISVFQIKNIHHDQQAENEKKWFKEQMRCDYKLVVFHCLDSKHQTELTQETQLSVVGNYLCHRLRTQRVVWVTQLKQSNEYFIPLSVINQGTEGLIKSHYKEYMSRALIIKQMVDEKDIRHIQMTEVPKAYFTTQRSRKGLTLNFYDNLLQITEQNHGMIFDLDEMKEIEALENIDQLQDPDRSVSTGFIMSTSKNLFSEEIDKTKNCLRRTQVFTNEYINLMFERVQDRYEKKVDLKISGMLFRTFSDIDLQELKKVSSAITNRQKMPSIDMEAVVCTYEGHTIFSIFQEHIVVYEQILRQLKEHDFPDTEDFNGNTAENPYLRRLHRILLTPTADWIESATIRKDVTSNIVKNSSRLNQFLQRAAIKLGKSDGLKREGNVGFKSIRQKSLHFQSARFRESLIEISMFCAENQINDFVENLEDAEILFTSMSPATVEFFQNAFYQTRFTKRVKNLKWRMGDGLQVFGTQTSVITEPQTESALAKGKEKDTDSAQIQYRHINVKMLSLDWLHSSYKGFSNVGFKELILALANAPHESLFSTQFVITLVQHFWEYYYKRIFWACFVPYIVYFLSTIYYVSNYAVPGIDEDQFYAFTLEFVLRIIIYVLVCYFAMFEFVSMFRDGSSYLFDVFNYFDWAAFILNFYLLLNIVAEKQAITEEVPLDESSLVDAVTQEALAGDEEEANFDTLPENRKIIRQMAGISMTFMWVKTFYWMSLFSGTAFYIRLIRETLYDIKYFLILFIFIMMCFGNAILVMNQGRSQDVYTKVFGVAFLDSMLNQYILTLGDYDTENFRSEGGDIIIWCLFIMATFITQITFLNLLIAIMGDTFDRVSEVKEQSALAEKIKILADYVIIVRESDVDSDTFLFAVTPAQLGSDEQASWEGTVTQLKKAIDTTMKQSQSVMARRMQTVNDGMESLNNRMTTIDERISELSGAQQKLPIEISKMVMRLPNEIEQTVKKIIRAELNQTDRSSAMTLCDQSTNRGMVSARLRQDGAAFNRKVNHMLKKNIRKNANNSISPQKKPEIELELLKLERDHSVPESSNMSTSFINKNSQGSTIERVDRFSLIPVITRNQVNTNNFRNKSDSFAEVKESLEDMVASPLKPSSKQMSELLEKPEIRPASILKSGRSDRASEPASQSDINENSFSPNQDEKQKSSRKAAFGISFKIEEEHKTRDFSQ